ncbi:helix-turn-helix transcriptional regulator [Holzapfeliella sp. JNUCC72]
MKYIRNYHNLTQDQLATKLNVSRKTISAWENNRGIPDYYLVKAIEQLFSIDSDNLLNPKKEINFDIFELKRKHLLKIKIISVIEILSLIIGYLTLVQLVNTFYNTLFLLFNTFYLNKLINNYYKNFSQKLSEYVSPVGLFGVILIANILLGGIFTVNLINSNLHQKMEYHLGKSTGLFIVSLIVSYAVFMTYKVAVILYKEKTPNISKKGSRINNKLNN